MNKNKKLLAKIVIATTLFGVVAPLANLPTPLSQEVFAETASIGTITTLYDGGNVLGGFPSVAEDGKYLVTKLDDYTLGVYDMQNNLIKTEKFSKWVGSNNNSIRVFSFDDGKYAIKTFDTYRLYDSNWNKIGNDVDFTAANSIVPLNNTLSKYTVFATGPNNTLYGIHSTGYYMVIEGNQLKKYGKYSGPMGTITNDSTGSSYNSVMLDKIGVFPNGNALIGGNVMNIINPNGDIIKSFYRKQSGTFHMRPDGSFIYLDVSKYYGIEYTIFNSNGDIIQDKKTHPFPVSLTDSYINGIKNTDRSTFIDDDGTLYSFSKELSYKIDANNQFHYYTQEEIDEIRGSVELPSNYLSGAGLSKIENSRYRIFYIVHTGTMYAFDKTTKKIKTLGFLNENIKSPEFWYARTVNLDEDNTVDMVFTKFPSILKHLSNAGTLVTSITPPDLNVQEVQGKTELSWSYTPEEEEPTASSYELQLNGEVLYSGTDLSFTDMGEKLPATSYQYLLIVKDENGLPISKASYSIDKPLNVPTNFHISDTVENGVTVKWDGNKNPVGTEYFLTAEPLSGGLRDVSLEDNFTDNTNPLSLNGTWYTTSGYSRSKVISHGGSTFNEFTIDIPSNAVNPSLSFDYNVSSESGYDKLMVYVNNSVVLNDSGLKSWNKFSRSLTPGKHTIKFGYSKDGSVSRGDDAAFIDNLKVAYQIDGTKKANTNELTYTFNDLNLTDKYRLTLYAKYNNLTTEVISIETGEDKSQEIANSLNELEEVMSIGLHTQSDIDNTQSQLDEIVANLETLPDSQQKQELLQRVEEIQAQITLAQQELDAKNSVAALIELVNGDLSTQELIDNAQYQLEDASQLVQLLPTSTLKTELVNLIQEAEIKIAISKATLEVNEVDTLINNGLETQTKINDVQAQIDIALEFVSSLPESNVKTELLDRLNQQQEQVEIAQATLNVIIAETSKSQDDINTAVESLQSVDTQSVKDTLLNRLEVVQDIINADNLLTDILASDYTNFSSIENALTTLNNGKAIIDGLPNESVDNPYLANDKLQLIEKYTTAKDYLGKELISVLSHKTKGKPERLSTALLDLLVEYAIKDTNATSIKDDRGTVVSYVMEIANKHTTGNEVNKSIEKFLK